jgi:succinate dehydrogenase/fumarate reductase flavoprotein subunit
MTKIPTMECDVIVIDGGAAGVGAAAGASQAGARTLLIERGSYLGGAATQKNVLTTAVSTLNPIVPCRPSVVWYQQCWTS